VTYGRLAAAIGHGSILVAYGRGLRASESGHIATLVDVCRGLKVSF
jgi:hypothetical protein